MSFYKKVGYFLAYCLLFYLCWEIFLAVLELGSDPAFHGNTTSIPSYVWF